MGGEAVADTRTMGFMRLSVSIFIAAALAGCGSVPRAPSGSGQTSAAHTAAGARAAVLAFFNDVQAGRYAQACALYTPSTRALVDRESGGCVRNLAGLHALAENQR